MDNSVFDQNKAIHDKISEVYNIKHKEIYNSVEQTRVSGIVECTANMVEKPYGEISVIDIGAGTGNLAIKYLDIGCRVTAADVSDRSLDLLTHHASNPENLSHHVIRGADLRLPDKSFDIVCAYSVLHHIPDYLRTVKEMIRIARSGGLIYIDHEANSSHYRPCKTLTEYRRRTKQTALEHIIKLHRTRELYTFGLFKAVFVKVFLNRRFRREGDIHVWVDDCIEWDKIFGIAEEYGVEVLRDVDYLLYRPKGGVDLYREYSGKCADTKYVIMRKAKVFPQKNEN